MTPRKAFLACPIAVLLVGGIALYRVGAPAPAPSYETVRAEFRPSEQRLLDRHGEPIHELRVDMSRRRLPWTAIADISPVTLAAVVQAEDRRFYAHGGVDSRAAAGGLWQALSGGSRRGASTLTMQLAAQLYPGLRARAGGRGPKEKWAQMRAAWALEAGWDKGRILEAYLNLVSFRGELQGIAAASQGLFGKTPAGLDGMESWLLAALLRSPNAAPERVAERACRLAEAAGEACRGLRSLAQAALRRPPEIPRQVALAPHVARKLLRAPETRRHDRTRPSESWQIASTLDAGLQRGALAALRHQLRQLEDRNVRHGAVLAVDNASGEVLVYVGNPGEDQDTRYVDGVQAPRQAGSTLKPFLYALALEARLLTAASMLEDSPLNLTTPTGLYVPQNYDHASRGFVSVRTALAASLNIPAVRALVLVGTERFVSRLRELGFRQITQDGDYYGYSLALGSAEVTLWELVNAYRTLALGGVAGRLVLGPDHAAPPSRRVMDGGEAFIVSDILADPAARSVTFGLDSALATPIPSAVKTGTSKDMRDNWCIGYSPRYTVGVWVGNFDGEPMHDVSGVTGAAPVWHELMDRLHRDQTGLRMVPPGGVVTREVSFDPAAEAPRREWFLAGTAMDRIRFTAAANRRPRIAYPGRDMTIALDPDIPAGRERLFFRAEPALPGLRWELDRVAVVASAGWRPVPGRHQLELIDHAGKVQDRTTFAVRGRP
jgi:penicillin-binding protein 1C